VDIPGANDPIYTHTELSSGFYYYRYLLANSPGNLANAKCRVNSNIKIVYVVPKFWEITDTLCQGLSYVVEDNAYDQTGIYVDSLLSSLGCDSIVTLNLTIVPDSDIGAEVSVLDPECANTAAGSISIDGINNAAPPVTYFFDGADFGSFTFYENLLAGDYTVKIEDRFGCFFEETYSISDPPAFVVDVGNDVFVELGEQVTIAPNINFPVDTFFWLPDPLMCDPACWELQWTPKASVDLLLTAVSEKGCVAADSVRIGVIRNRNVYIPNVFSPNDDGVNDAFTIFGRIPNVQRINKFMIFDRWGNLVFEQKDFLPNDESSGWNGRINGSMAPNGVYIYVAEILFYDEELIEYSGSVMLVK
jgi:gliding motility-associated-like protein